MNTKKGHYQGVLISLLCVAAASLSFMIPAKSTITSEMDEIRVGRDRSIIVTPDYHLRVDVWTDQSSYYTGEDIRIYFHANKDAYVYVFNTDTNGITRQIFPNYFDSDNFVRGGRTYSIPDPGYRLEVTGPSGREYLRILAVSRRHSFLRKYERFRSSDPFPRLPGGIDGFRHDLESQIPGERLETDDYRSPRDQKDGLAVRPRVIRPGSPGREYAESYTSFYVRARWHYRDDPWYGPHPSRKIRFRSLPDDAGLYIDSRYYGETSKRIQLTYGPHKVRMRRRGYQDWVRYIYVNEHSQSTITAHMVRYRAPYHWEPYRREWDLDFRDWKYDKKEELDRRKGETREEQEKDKRKREVPREKKTPIQHERRGNLRTPGKEIAPREEKTSVIQNQTSRIQSPKRKVPSLIDREDD